MDQSERKTQDFASEDSERIFNRIKAEIDTSSIEKAFRETALYDLEQARIAYNAGAFKACIIMLGAVLEGIMLGAIRQSSILDQLKGDPNPPAGIKKIGLKHPKLADKIAEELDFEDYKNVVHHLIPDIEKSKVDGIQSFRNAVHPWKAVREPSLYADYDRISTRAMGHLTSLEILVHRITSVSKEKRGGLIINFDSGDVWVDGHRTETLTHNEFDLLKYLYSRKGSIVSRRDIGHILWPDRSEEESNMVIEKLVSRLRIKVEPNPDNPHYIFTVRGRGYRLESE